MNHIIEVATKYSGAAIAIASLLNDIHRNGPPPTTGATEIVQVPPMKSIGHSHMQTSRLELT
jgi:hypothetical protein